MHSLNSIDSEAMTRNVMGQFIESLNNEHQVSKDKVAINSSSLRSKRQQRVNQLKEQMEAHASGKGKCAPFVQAMTGLSKLISVPLNGAGFKKLSQLLTSSMERVRQAKSNGNNLHFQIDGEKMMKLIEQLKSHISLEIESLKEKEQLSSKETSMVLGILNNMQDTYSNVLQKGK